MKKIKVNVSENKYRMFEIIERLPELENLDDLEIKDDYYYPDERCSSNPNSIKTRIETLLYCPEGFIGRKFEP